ncbi:hypothetical protein [Palleronia marisminoris]|nr:hypothetical protein [Palleronia marisminoris]
MIQTVRTPSSVIDAAIAEFGARRVFLLALRAVLAPRQKPLPSADHLPNHLRRDIGLPRIDPPATGWDLLR